MMMIFRRSEDRKERASRLDSAAALVALAARVQLGSILNCLMPAERALGHAIKQWSSQSAMNGVTRFEGLAPRTERRPFCERRALAPPDDHHAVGSCADLL